MSLWCWPSLTLDSEFYYILIIRSLLHKYFQSLLYDWRLSAINYTLYYIMCVSQVPFVSNRLTVREDAVPSDMLAQTEEKRQELVGKSRVSQGQLTMAICMTATSANICALSYSSGFSGFTYWL